MLYKPVLYNKAARSRHLVVSTAFVQTWVTHRLNTSRRPRQEPLTQSVVLDSFINFMPVINPLMHNYLLSFFFQKRELFENCILPI